MTGATGILGSHLTAALLAKGAELTVLIRDWDPLSDLIRGGNVQRMSVVSGCLEDYPTLVRALSEHEIDTVFHLGAQTIVGSALRDPLGTFDANIKGTYQLLEASRSASPSVKVVVIASSDKAYGYSEALPYTEDMPLVGRHPYDVSKSCADLLAQAYAHTYKLNVGIARCGNIYGGGDLNWSRLVPGTIRSFLADRRPVLRSDGSFTRDYLYVADAAAGYIRLAEALSLGQLHGQAFNFSAEVRFTVMDIVRLLAHLMDKVALEPVILNEAVAEIHDQWLSSEKAHDVLGWMPAYTIESGLMETVSWYTRFLNG